MPVKLIPVITTDVPPAIGPFAGEMLVMLGRAANAIFTLNFPYMLFVNSKM